MQEYILCCLSRGDVDGIYDLYRASLSLGTEGKKTRDYIETLTQELCLRHKMEIVSSWRDFCSVYYDVNSPLRKLCICNDYIIISNGTVLPYSKERFFQLLKKTTLKGMRTISSNLNEECLFVKRMGTELTIEPYEEFADKFFSPSREGILEDVIVDEKGFRLYPNLQTSELELVADIIEQNQPGFVILNLDEEGEYQEVNGLVSFLTIKIELNLVCISLDTYSRNPPFSSSILGKYTSKESNVFGSSLSYREGKSSEGCPLHYMVERRIQLRLLKFS